MGGNGHQMHSDVLCCQQACDTVYGLIMTWRDARIPGRDAEYSLALGRYLSAHKNETRHIANHVYDSSGVLHIDEGDHSLRIMTPSSIM